MLTSNNTPSQGELTETPVKRALYGELQLPFKHSYIDGEIYPPFIKEKSLENSRNFDIRDGDIFIATYPKNGTTWTQKIIQNLHKIHGTGLLQDNDKHLLEAMPWIENCDVTKIDAMESPRYIKTHNSYNNVAYDSKRKAKYIYVARNPKDVCVSLFHHCRGFAAFEYDGDFAEFSELFLKGHVESSDWWRHVKEFYSNSKEMDILFLKYEDMHADGIKAINQINDFCALPKLTEEQAAEVLELSTFKKMKEDPNSNYSWMDTKRKKDEAPFMRKGTVGDWANYFSEEMSALFDKKTNEMFEDIDLDFTDSL